MYSHVPRSQQGELGGAKRLGSPCGALRRGWALDSPPPSCPEPRTLSFQLLSPTLRCLRAVIPSNSPREISSTMTGKGAMSAPSEKNGAKSKAAAGPTGRDARTKGSPAAAAKSETTGSGSHTSPKKRRKVNHGKLSLRDMRQGFGSETTWFTC